MGAVSLPPHFLHHWKCLVKEYVVSSQIKYALSAALGVILGLNVMIKLLLACIALDVLTGLLAAVVSASVSSEISRAGMARKAMIIIITLASEVLGNALGVGVSIPALGHVSIGAAVASFYCTHELVSITENVGRAGIPLPKFVRSRMKQLQKIYGDI